MRVPEVNSAQFRDIVQQLLDQGLMGCERSKPPPATSRKLSASAGRRGSSVVSAASAALPATAIITVNATLDDIELALLASESKEKAFVEALLRTGKEWALAEAAKQRMS